MLPLVNTSRPRQKPYLTYAIIGTNILVFLWQASLGELEFYEALLQYAVVPHEITSNFFNVETVLDITRSIFMHGGWAHLIFNMLYLWIFGELLEDWLDVGPFAAFYLICGVAATFAQILINPNSLVPMVGASGAIAGVMGGYVVLFPTTYIRCFTFQTLFTGRLSEIPASGVILLWFLLQLLGGVVSLDMGAGEGGVAFFAHLGGFFMGIGMMRLYTRRKFSNRPSFPRKIIPMNEYRGINRNAPGVAYNWESTDATSGAALQRAEAKLQTLKEQASTKLAVPSVETPAEKPALDLTYFALPARKREAIRYLSTQRGSIVTIQTDSKMVHTGKVTRLTGTQVVLEDEENNARWLLFTEIIKIF